MAAVDDPLFLLPPEEFTAARDELAASLKGEGDTAQAKAVKGLRRPTVAAWAVNLAVRAAPEAFVELTDLHRDLEKAQRQMLSGVRTADLPALNRRRNQAVDAMVEEAVRAAAAHDRDVSGHRDDIRTTFQAVVADPDAAAAVRPGRLQTTLPAPAGFGTLAGLSVVPDRPRSEEEPSTGGPQPAAGQPAEHEDQVTPAAVVPRSTADAHAEADRRAEAERAREREERLDEARRLRTAVAGAAEKALAHARQLERKAAGLAEDAERAEGEAARRTREAEAATARADQARGAAERAREDADLAAGRAGRARGQADTAVAQVQEADALLQSLEDAGQEA